MVSTAYSTNEENERRADLPDSWEDRVNSFSIHISMHVY